MPPARRLLELGLPGGYRWPTFNIADVLLVVGVAAIVLVSLRKKTPTEPGPSPA